MEELVAYSNDEKTLLSVPPLTELTIKAVALYIKGGEGQGAFIKAKNSIESVFFETGSNLLEFPPFCFNGCSKLKFVDIAKCEKLKTISENAFSSCPLLTSLELPSSLKTIGNGAFQKSGFTSMYIPASVQTIGNYLLFHCYSLTSFVIDNESPISEIQDHSFTYTKITKLKITKDITSCYGHAFEFCTYFTEFEVDSRNTLFSVENGVLYSFNKDTLYFCPAGKTGSLTVNESNVYITSCGFHSSLLTSVTFSNKLYSIGTWAFCAARITSLSFPESLRTLEQGSFSSCTELTTVTFSEGLTNLGVGCFYGCSKLADVTLPSTITYFGGSAFKECSPNLELKFHPNSNLKVDNQLKIITDKDGVSLFQYLGDSEAFEVPSGIKTIGDSSFYANLDIKQITFQAGSQITSISESAFYECTNLASFTFLDSLQTIGNSAFYRCTSLTTLTFGKQLNTIDKEAFCECNGVTTITFSETSNVAIKEGVFKSCTILGSIEGSKAITEIGKSGFEFCSSLTSITIPGKTTSIGMFAFKDSGLVSCIFEPDSQLSIIETRTFCNCAALKTFVFPDNVHTLGAFAFYNTLLDDIKIPASVRLIKESCFENCKKLVYFHIPSQSQLEEFELSVFLGCNLFSNITCETDSNFVVDNYALYNKDKTELIILPPDSKVKYFSFPESLKKVGICALQGCHNIEIIFIPYSVTEIKAHAFYNCVKLHSINIPYTVEKISVNAFYGCRSIVCGISVDNTDKDFIDNLINVAKLPRDSMKKCGVCFSCESPKIFANSLFAFIAIHILVNV